MNLPEVFRTTGQFRDIHLLLSFLSASAYTVLKVGHYLATYTQHSVNSRFGKTRLNTKMQAVTSALDIKPPILLSQNVNTYFIIEASIMNHKTTSSSEIWKLVIVSMMASEIYVPFRKAFS